MSKIVIKKSKNESTAKESRGLSESEAFNMLIYALAGKIIGTFKSPKARKAMLDKAVGMIEKCIDEKTEEEQHETD